MLTQGLKNMAKFALRFLPDEPYVKLYYRVKMGRALYLRRPETFSAKLQWLKLFDRDPVYTTLVDKLAVKAWVAERVGEDHLVPTLRVWESAEAIDFDALPDRFVLKCTHDSGGLVICRDRDKFDAAGARLRIGKALARNYFQVSREWPYKDVPPRVIAEPFLEDGTDGEGLPVGLTDYKFYCFGGEPKFLYVSKGLEDHATAIMGFVELDWTPAPFRRDDYRPLEELPPRPKSFARMIELARALSQDLPFARVDLYEIDGVPKFSEVTLCPVGGFMRVQPESWDQRLGELLDLRLAGYTEPR